MVGAKANSHFAGRRRRVRQSTTRRLLILLVAVAATTASSLAVIVWWEDRPLNQAEVWLENKEYDRAHSAIDDYLQLHPRHGRALMLKARAFAAQGLWTKAIGVYDRVGAAEPQDVHAYAKCLLHEEQWSRALPLLEYLAQEGDDDPDVLHELSACRAKLGFHDLALESAKRFSQVPGLEGRGFLLIGTLHREKRNLSQSAKAWRKVLEYERNAENLQVPNHEFFREYGSVLLDLGEPGEAVAKLLRSLKLQTSAKTLVLLGNAYSRSGELQKAENAWQQAATVDPSHSAARLALANLALSRADAEAALDWLAPMADDEKIPSSQAYLFQRAYALAGDAAESAIWQIRTEQARSRELLNSTIDQLLIDSPQSMWTRVVRAYRFAEERNWRQAEALISPILKQSSDQPFVQALAKAIRARGTLPPLEGLPIEQF